MRARWLAADPRQQPAAVTTPLHLQPTPCRPLAPSSPPTRAPTHPPRTWHAVPGGGGCHPGGGCAPGGVHQRHFHGVPPRSVWPGAQGGGQHRGAGQLGLHGGARCGVRGARTGAETGGEWAQVARAWRTGTRLMAVAPAIVIAAHQCVVAEHAGRAARRRGMWRLSWAEQRQRAPPPVMPSCRLPPVMDWSDGDNWSLTVDLPAGQHEFKVRGDDQQTWLLRQGNAEYSARGNGPATPALHLMAAAAAGPRAAHGAAAACSCPSTGSATRAAAWCAGCGRVEPPHLRFPYHLPPPLGTLLAGPLPPAPCRAVLRCAVQMVVDSQGGGYDWESGNNRVVAVSARGPRRASCWPHFARLLGAGGVPAAPSGSSPPAAHRVVAERQFAIAAAVGRCHHPVNA